MTSSGRPLDAADAAGSSREAMEARRGALCGTGVLEGETVTDGGREEGDGTVRRRYNVRMRLKDAG